MRLRKSVNIFCLKITSFLSVGKSEQHSVGHCESHGPSELGIDKFICGTVCVFVLYKIAVRAVCLFLCEQQLAAVTDTVLRAYF